ncbi:unnamed protein product [Ilex paraguariensis]|uniref:Uncharacterized protein n=1 Tax=Ilex paraguariensis TaxID=185542 RepID=A0ABC8R0T4_9AQUA
MADDEAHSGEHPGFNESVVSIHDTETGVLPSGSEETSDETSEKQQTSEAEVVPPFCPTVFTDPSPENTPESTIFPPMADDEAHSGEHPVHSSTYRGSWSSMHIVAGVLLYMIIWMTSFPS